VWCSVSQCDAVYGNVLICAIVFRLRFLRCSPVCKCSVLQCGAACCSVLRCGAVWCSVVQCVAVWCNVLQCVDLCDSLSSEISEMLAYVQVQCVAVCYSVLRCVAEWISVVQCAADFYIMLQCAAGNALLMPSTRALFTTHT